MADSDDDKVSRILRGNTEHDPKPDFASRRNAAPRGVGAPSLTPFGGGSSQTRPQRPERDNQTNAPRAPIAPNLSEGQKPTFRRLGEPKPQTAPEHAVEQQKDRPFRGFGRSDLGRDFKDRSR
jgi:hypothetical protein